MNNANDDVKELNEFWSCVIDDVDMLIANLPEYNKKSSTPPFELFEGDKTHKLFIAAWGEARPLVKHIVLEEKDLSKLKENGLTGEQRKLKLYLYYKARKNGKKENEPDRWMKRLLGFIDPILDSLTKVHPAFGLVTEIKKLAENCF